MMKRKGLVIISIIAFSISHLAMARHGQYDEEAREIERLEKQRAKMSRESKNPAKGLATGIKEATVDSTTEFIQETATTSGEEAPIVGTLEGARKGSGQVLDKTVKGAYRVATLGFGELEKYEVEEPERGTDETTKIKISLPGT